MVNFELKFTIKFWKPQRRGAGFKPTTLYLRYGPASEATTASLLYQHSKKCKILVVKQLTPCLN